MMMTIPAMIHASRAAVPAACAARNAPKSQPEPMIEVSDAQVAPIKPISRFRPTSVGTEAEAPTASVLLAMLDPFSDRAPQGCHPRVGSSVMQVSVVYALSENIVEIRP